MYKRQGYVGPLAGILSGMRFAEKNGFTSILTVASDTPFFPADLVSKLSNASAKDNALISLAATKQNDKLVRHPTFGLWSVSLADDLEKNIQAGFVASKVRSPLIAGGMHVMQPSRHR